MQFHAVKRRGGKTVKIVYLNRLPWDRLCAARVWIRQNNPGLHAALLDPGFNAIIRMFQGEVPMEFEVKKQ